MVLNFRVAPEHKGKGNMMVWGKADWDRGLGGRPVMERLYDFNALPGTRKLVRQFLLQNMVTVRARLPGVNISDHAMRVCAPSFVRRVLLTSRCCTAQLTAHAGIR